MRDIRAIVVHHSASPRSTTIDDIDGWHRAKGWSGVGYHFVIHEDGEIAHGRELHKPGAHAKGHNSYTIGICVTGDNTDPNEAWNQRQWRALDKLLDALLVLWPHADIVGHRALRQTECPGIEV